MFNKILKILFVIICIVGVGYLVLPNFSFPVPPPDSIQSQEPADLESPLRRGYFTNFSRAEALTWYEKQFNHSDFNGIRLPTLLLNYPPEYAQTLIRDQTSSTFLQEFVHPFRESMYVNGFEPQSLNSRPIFSVDGRSWKLKIIIRLVPTNIWIREIIFAASMVMIVILYNNVFLKEPQKKNE